MLLKVLMGTLVNGGAIVAGALGGLLVGKVIPRRCHETIMHGIGLAVILVGLRMALQSEQVLLLIISLILGGITGEILCVEKRLLTVGNWLEKRCGKGRSPLAQAFVYATLIYVVGAMAITGALESGLLGEHNILYTKSILDGVTAAIFASSMGVGVAFSALPVILYQGSIALLAGVVASLLTGPVITELTAVGGILILAIGLNLLELKKFRVGNLLPALLFIPVLVLVFG